MSYHAIYYTYDSWSHDTIVFLDTTFERVAHFESDGSGGFTDAGVQRAFTWTYSLDKNHDITINDPEDLYITSLPYTISVATKGYEKWECDYPYYSDLLSLYSESVKEIVELERK